MRPECASSTYDVPTSVEINAACSSYYRNPKEIKSNKDGVNKMHSEITSSIYLHINPSAQSYNYIINKVHIDKMTYLNDLFTTNGF